MREQNLINFLQKKKKKNNQEDQQVSLSFQIIQNNLILTAYLRNNYYSMCPPHRKEWGVQEIINNY